METSSSLNKKIVNYLDHLSNTQKKAVLEVVKAFATEVPNAEAEEDNIFFAEMDRRVNELKSGSVKGYSWDEVKATGRNAIASVKRK